jgi:ribulose 1,5-bisphosphate carboxylase large subunit-like protein
MQEYTLSSQERGIRMVMIDVEKTGLTGLQVLRKFCAEIGVLIAVTGLAKLITVNQRIHVSKKLMMKMLRMAGADMVMVSSTDAELADLTKTLLTQHDRVLRNFLPALPLISSVQTIEAVEDMIKSCGYDLALETHHVITSHPDGIRAGAEAFLAAINAAFHGIDQKTAAKKCESLKKILL